MIPLEIKYPQRIVCLTEEPTETLYSIGAEDLIVGISNYTKRPEKARKEKPRISYYTEAKIGRILELKPDLVIAWSDLQAEIVKELVREHVEVMCFNHRDISGILSFIVKLGGLINMQNKATEYANKLKSQLEIANKKGMERKVKPVVYFEEWFDPLITGIGWVSEIIELCGGTEAFPDKAHKPDAKSRIIASFDEVIPKNPDIIIASWCGKPVIKSKISERAGWEEINAIKNNEIHEIPSEIILQPGPAALTDGVDIIMEIIDKWEKKFG